MKIIKNAIAAIMVLSFTSLNAQDIQSTNANGKPTLITFETSKKSNNKFRKSNTTHDDPASILRQYLNLHPQDDEFMLIKSFSDNIGYKHFKYQQYYKGIKVDFATYIVHYKHGKLHAINGDYKAISDIKIDPSISESQALSNALNHVQAKQYIWEDIQSNISSPKAELVIIDVLEQEKNIMKLVYKFNIQAINQYFIGRTYINCTRSTIIID